MKLNEFIAITNVQQNKKFPQGILEYKALMLVRWTIIPYLLRALLNFFDGFAGEFSNLVAWFQDRH